MILNEGRSMTIPVDQFMRLSEHKRARPFADDEYEDPGALPNARRKPKSAEAQEYDEYLRDFEKATKPSRG